MSHIIGSLEGVCHMDDVLMHGTTVAEHDSRVRSMLTRIHEAGLTLNSK